MLYVDRILYSSVIYPANYGESEEEADERGRESEILKKERGRRLFFSLLDPNRKFNKTKKKKNTSQASSPIRSARTTTRWTSSCSCR